MHRQLREIERAVIAEGCRGSDLFRPLLRGRGHRQRDVPTLQILAFDEVRAHGGVAENAGGEFFIERVGTRDAPGNFVHFYGRAEAFELLQIREGRAGGRERRIIAQQAFMSAFADQNAAAAGETFQPAREIYFAAKDGVVELMLLGTHKAGGG